MIGYIDESIAPESGNAITATFQFKRLNKDDNPDGPIPVTIYLLEDTSYTVASYVISTTGEPTYVMTVATGTVIDPFFTNLKMDVLTDWDGTLAVTVTDASAAGTDSLYIGLKIGEKFFLSSVLTFA